MDDIPPLPPRKSSLSIDRAAFLLLRVKKAFKKKRQQRKDKLTLHNIHEPVGGARPLYGSRPIEKRAKLSRSLTLPIFNFGGTSAFVDRLQQQTQPLESFKTSSNNFLYESKITNVSTPISGNSPKILLTTTDDTSFDYRRKSSGGSGLFTPLPPSVAPADPHIYDFDEKRSSADGSVVISITSPTAYQIPMSKSFGLTSFNFVNLQNAANSATTAYSTGNNYVGSGRNNNFIGSGNVAPSDLGGSSMKRSSDTTAYGSAVSAQLINSSTNNAIYRLARIINQTTKATGPCGFTLPAPGLDTTHHQQVNDDSARRLSWERRDKDCKPIPRSSSIDSMVDVVWNEFPSSGSSSARNSMSNQSSNLLSNVPSNLNLFLSSNRRESVLSPSSNRRSKHQRGISEISLPDLVSRSLSTVGLPPCPTVKRCDERFPVEPNQASTVSADAGTIESTYPPVSSPTPSILSVPAVLTVEDERTRNLSRMTSASSPNLSSVQTKKMEFLLPHQQHPPGSQPAVPPSKRQVSPKIIKKTRHLSTSSVDDESGATHSPKPNNHRIGSLIETNNNNNNNNNHNVSNGSGIGGSDGGIDVLATTGKISSDRSASAGAHHPYWKRKITKKQPKMAQAQLDRMTQINIHLHALFAAVEHGHLEKARTILESTDVDVNSLKSDGLSPLDVAVLSNNRSMTKMLLQQGAIENAHTIQAANNNVGLHLNNLLCEAESTIHELGNFESGQPGQGSGGIGGTSGKTTFSNIIGSGGPSVTSCTGSDVDKQVGLWERRVKGLRRMILGWDQTKPPDLPHRIEIDVTGCTSISLRLYEPLEGAISTKFKVQWSSRSDFSNIVGEREVNEWTSFHGCMGAMCNLSELIQGRRYFFRACAGNIKGWGPFKQSTPNCVVPSSWRDVGSRENRFAGKQRNLDDLFNAVRLARPEDASEIALDAAIPVKRAIKKKTTIKQLFSAASKFQKNLKRGIYLACVLYHEDKLLLTNEDFVPVIEIDETFTSNLHTDFYWLMKVACTWDDVKLLRLDMERNASSAIHFRTKLLSAACQMQSALSITDLGQLYYKPLRDVHGTVVLSCVNCIKSPKSVSVLNSRWIPLNKIHKKLAISNEDSSINELLMNSIQEQINYHQVSNIRLPRGLYVGYLKMQSSVEVIQVVVPIKAPNVLPHCKIRDNPHVSAEEWELIRQHKHSNILEFRPKSQGPTEVQLHFLEILTKAMHNLFQYMDIPVDVAVVHRLYDIEVIELNHDVSFLIVCPPAESSCAVPGQKDVLLQRGDLFSMPIQAFEMIHLKTYQPSIVQKYSRLSCILELDTMMANHLHREAFSSSELQKAKDRLSKLQDLSTGLNTIWKGVRWLMDVISYARDRANMPELNMKQILDYKSTYFGKKISADKKVGSEAKLLQPPGCPPTFHKSSPGRGSWPGPAVENSLGHNGLLDAEHSKSEQLLKYNSQRFLDASSVNSRKNSADSAYSNSANSYYSVTGVEPEKDFVVPRLPPSRSEDTLIVDKKKVAEQTSSSKKRPPTMYSSYSATSSPLLNVRTPFVATIASVTKTTTGEDVENRVSNAPSLKVITKKPREQTLKTLNQIEPDYEPIVTTYLKPTLTALQNEAKGYQGAALHITEESPKHLQQLPPDVLNHRAITEPTIPDLAQSSQRRPIQPAPVVLQPKPVEASNSSETKPPTESTVAGSSASNSTAATTTPLITSIVQVYAAYETGLPSGTSLKLRVTQKTTAREVIDLVVKQLNMAVVLKGKEGPIYAAEKLDNFCLVAVIGARERCLRDDFRPLQLQNPWKKGRLYVRQKHDLLAAIEHSNRDTAEI
ncbi:uncharacterized protein LOC131434875 isoform X1 [Malaya genurostris]|uniref:uncharacterized protein LOC131434875 isoform X1 n=1 Tax=Malaya genurostris TaxID=325434 RepID=UPI0026F3BCEB|nr:uncharacterized protein LOC131434875 isoform X1 [Malaya genurostris]XP_058458097.1 uncharacterized protein LOC131434875 isoform X1 [Malaya genurostris]XP_058458104.1 uncharacterized protein LOC131434875 isoform X1 [Malaya genurostris]